MSLPNIANNTKLPTNATYRDAMERNDNIFQQLQLTKNSNL